MKLRSKDNDIKEEMNLGWGLVIQHVSSICEDLGSILSMVK
jgi:hypothetical protein